MIVLPRWFARRILVVGLLAAVGSTASASDARIYLTKGAIAISKLDFEQAIEAYSKGIAQQLSVKDRAELLMARGLAFDLAKKPDRAEADYTTAVGLVGESSPAAYETRGHFYFIHDRWDLALADYTAGAKLFPNDGDFPNGQGLALSNQGKFDEAISKFDEAVRLDPKSGTFYLGRAEAYNRSNRPQRALEDYGKALAQGGLVQREITRLRAGRGHAQLRLKNYDAAIADFNIALERAPRFVNVLKWRAFSYERVGDTGNAIRDYESALKLKPSDDIVAKRLQELRGK
ncbi:MAG: tetratricopeptide repeat protein [Rhizobiales bacterium]|nr:tetratricopeptide repeat protein [Hyphomicrobiales bacterium]